jgi:outer membrane protein
MRASAPTNTGRRKPRPASWLGGCLAGAGLLGTLGCVSLHPAVPAAALADRIVAPARLPPPAAVAETPTAPAPPLFAADEAPSPEGPLTLTRALALADQNNPRLLQMRARVEAARAGREVAFADFLPEANVTYRHIQGAPSHEKFALPTLPTAVGNVAFGGTSDRFQAAELHLQWTVFDFGRTLGRFGQAAAAADIAALQADRARQTVAFNVTAAYFTVLRSRAERLIAEEAVRRAEALLRDARNFLKRGTTITNDVLRTEVLLSEARLQLVRARTAEGVAVAALAQEMGVTRAFQVAEEPRQLGICRLGPEAPLEAALQLAVDSRPEFRAALKVILSARFGEGVAEADFLPKVVAGATAAHQETNDTRTTNLLSGGVGIELGLFEGGRRLGRLRGARAEAAVAIAQGQEVCDRIGFEATAAYLGLADARERLALTRTEVEHATENLRVVRRLFEKGDATPTDVVDADLALVRAQENDAAARYDYQTAVARLAYAVGVPVEVGPPDAGPGACSAPSDFAAERE